MRKRLGEQLIECGVIDERQLRVALAYQLGQRCRLGTALVDLGFATEEQVVAALARKLGFRRASLDMVEGSPELDAALALVPRELAASQGIFPVAVTRSTLSVAAHDPTNLAVFDDLAFRTGRRVEVLIAGEREVARTVARLMYRSAAPPHREVAAIDAGAAEEIELLPAWDVPADAALAPAGAGAGTAAAPPPGLARPLRDRVDAGERLVAQAVEQLLQGVDATSPEVTAARLVAALVRVLTRAGLVDRRELAAELVRQS